MSGRWTQSRVVNSLSSFESQSWKQPSKFEAGHDRRQENLHTNKDVSDRVIVKTRFPHAHRIKGEGDALSFLENSMKHPMKNLILVVKT